jgi:Cof subfamily protein (haloacid dehalogenase superfamily)
MIDEKPRLLACDIDGTLLGEDDTIPSANVSALAALRDRGVNVVLSSGRALISIRRIAAQMFAPRETDFYIGFNGALVAGGLASTPVWRQVLAPHVIADVVDYARQHDLVLQGYVDDEFIVEHDSEASRAYATGTAMERRIVDDMVRSLARGSPKLVVIDDHEVLRRHQTALEEVARPDGAASTPRFITTFSKPHFLEIMPTGVTKGEGLRRLCEHLRIPLELAVAVGDSYNDMEMLQEAGLGVAVANAPADVKAAADVVADRNAGDGAVAEVVERFF